MVYMAEQEEPVKRRVALKVIKLGMDTKSVIARFEAEQHALALMDHPGIAHVLDALFAFREFRGCVKIVLDTLPLLGRGIIQEQ